MPLEFLVGALAVLFILDAYYSGAETAMTALNRGQVELLIEEHPTLRTVLTGWKENPSRLLTTILVSSNITVIAFSSVATAISFRLSGGEAEGSHRQLIAAAATWAVSALVIICAEIAPKVVAKRHAFKTARWVLPGLLVTDTVLGPLIRVVVKLIFLITSPFAKVDQPFVPVVTEEELMRTVDESARGGAIEAEEKKMIESIIEFGDLVVSDVMVPRTEMIGIDIRTGVDKVLNILIDCGYSRLPVYDKDYDNIVGVLYAKDFLSILKDKDLIILQDVIRPAYYVPETKKITELLSEFRRGKIHLAVVVDEYGGTSGLVTLEDLVEEIVGDIKDEYDHEPELLRAQPDGSWVADAAMDVDEVNDRLRIELPENGETNSLGGYLNTLWQNVPGVGEERSTEKVKFTILEGNERRVEKVRLEIIQPAVEEDDNGADPVEGGDAGGA